MFAPPRFSSSRESLVVHALERIERAVAETRKRKESPFGPGELRLAVAGSPKYFKSHSIPRHPQDLKDHACIGFRFSKGLYRWEFEKGRKALTVAPQGPVSFDDPELVIQAVLAGVGIGTAMEDSLKPLIADGRLVQVLKDWCPSYPGYFLYYPSRRNQPAALASLIEALRLA